MKYQAQYHEYSSKEMAANPHWKNQWKGKIVDLSAPKYKEVCCVFGLDRQDVEDRLMEVAQEKNISIHDSIEI